MSSKQTQRLSVPNWKFSRRVTPVAPAAPQTLLVTSQDVTQRLPILK